MSEQDVPFGTLHCPVCGHPSPHDHTPEEKALRPEIDWAWQAFEQSCLQDILMLTGEPWRGNEFERELFHPLLYKSSFTRRLWVVWKKAWLQAKGKGECK